MEWAFVGFLLLAAAGLSVCLVDAWRSRERLLFLLPALPYGVGLEQLVILQYERYVYSVDAFFVTLGDVPVVIGVGWAVILYSGWRIATEFGATGVAVPSIVALFALHIDFAVDVIAIRVPYWQWTPAGVWFGVPVGNFLGWAGVAAFYAGLWTGVRRLYGDVAAAVAAPVGSIVPLVVMLSTWQVIEPMLVDWMRFGFVGVLVCLLFVGALYDQQLRVRRFPLVAEVVSVLFHAWFFLLLVVYEVWMVSVLIPVISVAMALVGVAVAVIGWR